MNITIRRGKIVQSDVGAPSNQMQRRQKNPGRPTSTPGSKDLVVAEQDPPQTASFPSGTNTVSSRVLEQALAQMTVLIRGRRASKLDYKSHAFQVMQLGAQLKKVTDVECRITRKLL